MSIFVKNGVLHVSGAQEKLRGKGQERPAFLTDYTLLDIETTGLSPYRDRVTELGAIKVVNNEVVDQYTNLTFYPKSNKVPAFITKLNGITEERLLSEGVPVADAMKDFRAFIGDDVIIGYNVNFDLNFLYDLAKKFHLPELNNDYVDVLRLARAFYPHEKHNRLLDCMQRAGIAQVEEHHGLADSLDTKKVYDDFRDNFTPALLEQAQAHVKNIDLLEKELAPLQYGFHNPVKNKRVLFTGNLAMDKAEAATMVSNLGGQVDQAVTPQTDYVISGDHDFFDKKNEDLKVVRDLSKQGAKIRSWSESFFLNMLDDWARR
ncbi:exonuclease domain-containing protein [Lactobacillus sp. ESL0791]|uniref:exonuclease domain-containing protein n=1 Tax=Lactobacillus sp. ESL0791 TaxID=2983234 RepID=UPI0023F9FAF1|nr:exonuclease domain-containing protein [Lactobacillus sp. ESL0791]MDF7638346.1 exonuclease domain-containing protein [Lactobacillus sp. ESL0791]